MMSIRCNKKTAIIALFALSTHGGLATAQQNNLYFSLFGGASVLDDDSVDIRQNGAATRTGIDYDSGFLAGAAVGYRLSDSWRLEGELVYRTNDLALDGSDADGDFSSLVLGINGYYDITSLSDRLTPYLGLGLAWAQEIDIDFERPGGEQSYSSDEFGFQAMLGARYRLTDTWALNAELRYLDLGLGDIDLEREGGAGEVTASYDPLSLLLGVSYRW